MKKRESKAAKKRGASDPERSHSFRLIKAEEDAALTRGTTIASGGSSSVRRYENHQTKEKVAGKQHADKDAFEKELETLQQLMQMDKGKEVAMELEGFDAEKMILFVELADGSLFEQLEECPSGLPVCAHSLPLLLDLWLFALA